MGALSKAGERRGALITGTRNRLREALRGLATDPGRPCGNSQPTPGGPAGTRNRHREALRELATDTGRPCGNAQPTPGGPAGTRNRHREGLRERATDTGRAAGNAQPTPRGLARSRNRPREALQERATAFGRACCHPAQLLMLATPVAGEHAVDVLARAAGDEVTPALEPLGATSGVEAGDQRRRHGAEACLVQEHERPAGGLQAPLDSLLEPLLNSLLEPLLDPLLKPLLDPLLEPLLDPLLEPLLTPFFEPLLEPLLNPLLEPLLKPLLDPLLEPLRVDPACHHDLLTQHRNDTFSQPAAPLVRVGHHRKRHGQLLELARRRPQA